MNFLKKDLNSFFLYEWLTDFFLKLGHNILKWYNKNKNLFMFPSLSRLG